MAQGKHVALDKTASYRIRVDLGPESLTGQGRRKMRTCKSKKEAESTLRQWLAEIEHGPAVEDGTAS